MYKCFHLYNWLAGSNTTFFNTLVGCRTNANCPYDETCLHGRCQRVCELSGACGQNAHCTPYSHEARCSCPADLTGDPLVICQPGKFFIYDSNIFLKFSMNLSIGISSDFYIFCKKSNKEKRMKRTLCPI